jgi:hypothetical protein
MMLLVAEFDIVVGLKAGIELLLFFVGLVDLISMWLGLELVMM